MFRVLINQIRAIRQFSSLIEYFLQNKWDEGEICNFCAALFTFACVYIQGEKGDSNKVSSFVQQYYCPFSFSLSLQGRKGREKMEMVSVKGDTLLFIKKEWEGKETREWWDLDESKKQLKISSFHFHFQTIILSLHPTGIEIPYVF